MDMRVGTQLGSFAFFATVRLVMMLPGAAPAVMRCFPGKALNGRALPGLL